MCCGEGADARPSLEEGSLAIAVGAIVARYLDLRNIGHHARKHGVVRAAIVAALRSTLRRSGTRRHEDGRVERAVAATMPVSAVVRRAAEMLVQKGFSAATTKSALLNRLAS